MPLICSCDTSLDLSGQRSKVTVNLPDSDFRLRPMVAPWRCSSTARAFVYSLFLHFVPSSHHGGAGLLTRAPFAITPGAAAFPANFGHVLTDSLWNFRFHAFNIRNPLAYCQAVNPGKINKRFFLPNAADNGNLTA